MKIELPDSIVEQLREPLARCRETPTPSVLAGQVMPGDWRDGGPDKLFLVLAIIKPETARKIRALIIKDREAAAQ